ncbi:MAG TPA: hypothetical protein VG820_01095, partial [Fimbriimonadaceae bacterium]|nr:hypothetical protein [Fimbriimonadaceae bacterium]
SEAFLSAFTYQTAMRGNVIRPGPTVGDAALPGAPVKSDRRLREIVATALRGEDIPVVQNEGRQFIAARDLADVYASVLRSGANRQTYLAVASDYVSWEKIAREAVAITGSSSRILVEDRELSPCQFDAGKIGREFGLEFRCRPAILDELRRLAVGERLK